jgi:hypothetical protein
MGRPRKWKNDAEKAKAYRERKRAAQVGVTKGQTALVQRVVAADAKQRG